MVRYLANWFCLRILQGILVCRIQIPYKNGLLMWYIFSVLNAYFKYLNDPILKFSRIKWFENVLNNPVNLLLLPIISENNARLFIDQNIRYLSDNGYMYKAIWCTRYTVWINRQLGLALFWMHFSIPNMYIYIHKYFDIYTRLCIG